MDRLPMVPGTYWDDERQRYLAPDDPDWTEEGYEAAAGEPWMVEDADG